MRCSERDSKNLRPVMFTSTPISKSKRKLAFTLENSPIPRLKPKPYLVPDQLLKYDNKTRHPISIFKVLGNKKILLNSQERRNLTQKQQKQAHPPMVVISDSEEEDNLDREITLLQSMFNSSTTKNSSNKEAPIELKEDNVRQSRNRNVVKPVKTEPQEKESKKSLRRVSRVATIIDEIIKEGRSTSLAAPSPMIKVKSENSIDAIVEEEKKHHRRVTRSSVLTTMGTKVSQNQRRNTFIPNILPEEEGSRKKTVEANQKLKDIGNKGKITTGTRKRAKATIIKNEEEKENNIEYEQDYKLEGIGEQKIALQEVNINNNVQNNEEEIVFKSFPSEQLPPSIHQKPNPLNSNKISLSKGGELFNGVLPVIYKSDEIEDNEWTQLTNQKGVYVKKNFCLPSGISSGFVKLAFKCSLTLQSPKSQIFHVADGRGLFMYENVEVKIMPGNNITVPSGFPCKIFNTGTKRDLILSYTKVDGRE